MKKEIVFIIVVTAILLGIAFLATLPGKYRADKSESETSASETDDTTILEETLPPDYTPIVTDENGAIVVTGETEGEDMQADNEWALYVVNQSHPLPDDFVVYPKKVQGDYEMDYRAATYMIDMIDAAKADGIDIQVVSALRTIEYQQNLLDKEIQSYKEQGYNDDDAYKKATEGVAVPGQSEHNAGLAADLNQLSEDFENTDAFKWLDEHAQDYGFILRYPKGKQDITGIYYEPWHYRFVGVYHAKKIKESGLTLEEYCQNIGG